MSTISTISSNVGRTLSRNSPTIFTVIGGLTLFGAIAAAIKATGPAIEALDGERRFRYEEYQDERPLTYVDILKVTWRFYIPTTALAITSLACMTASNSINLRRNAALASVLTIAESGYREYQNQVLKQLGGKKEEHILAGMAQEELNNAPEPDKDNVTLTSYGATLFRDSLSGQFFYGDKDHILRVINLFNARLLREMDIPVKELYYDLELPATADWMNLMNWSSNHGLIDVTFSPGNTPKTDQLCWVVKHRNMPVFGWGQ